MKMQKQNTTLKVGLLWNFKSLKDLKNAQKHIIFALFHKINTKRGGYGQKIQRRL